MDSYIKDTGCFLEILKKLKSLPKNSKLVAIDMKTLYTSILHHEHLEALREALSTDPDLKIPVKVLVKLTELILKNKVFNFNGTHYRQIQGTAMGTY